jgi:hypothetical protein
MSARALRRPVWIVYVFVVGLALHNLVMSLLYAAGLRGAGLELVSAWKEALLALGLVLVLRAHGSLRFRPTGLDWLALAYGAIVVVYGLLPQRWLGGAATHHGILLGEREDLLPVACYFFGRGLALSRQELRGVGATIVATGCGVALFGLVDIWAIPLSWWRQSSGAVGWFSHQLGFAYGAGLTGLPQNFVYNTGNGHALRRLVSTFLSPLASSYLLVVALIACVAWRLALRAPLRLWLPATALLSAGLLWTHSRSSYIALALALVVVAWRLPPRRVPLLAGAVAVVGVGFLFVDLYSHLAPVAPFTRAELVAQAKAAHAPGAGPAVSSAVSDASTTEHLRELRAGIDQVVRHPQGFGPGNAGSNAARTKVAVKAGESTYTEIGVDTGLAGALVFIAWSLALLWRLLRIAPWLAAALVAVLALALQTDVLGVPWLVYVLWTLFGSSVSTATAREPLAALAVA